MTLATRRLRRRRGRCELVNSRTSPVRRGTARDAWAGPTADAFIRGERAVHQINFARWRQCGLQAAKTEVASKSTLERLIDQQLLLGRVHILQLDSDSQVGDAAVESLPDDTREVSLRALGTLQCSPCPPPANDRRRGQGRTGIHLARKTRSGEAHRRIHRVPRRERLRFTGDQGARATEQPSLKRLDVIDEQKDGRPS